jgi:hypothetical protein
MTYENEEEVRFWMSIVKDRDKAHNLVQQIREEKEIEKRAYDDIMQQIKIQIPNGSMVVREFKSMPSTNSVMQTPKADEPKPGSRPTDF